MQGKWTFSESTSYNRKTNEVKFIIVISSDDIFVKTCEKDYLKSGRQCNNTTSGKEII